MENYKVDKSNNFCRVFEVPEKYPKGFCNPAVPVEFKMVDWFNPIPPEVNTVNLEKLRNDLVPWLKGKIYIKPGRSYLVLFDFGATLTFYVE